jgi:hypothetical protein
MIIGRLALLTIDLFPIERHDEVRVCVVMPFFRTSQKQMNCQCFRLPAAAA